MPFSGGRKGQKGPKKGGVRKSFEKSRKLLKTSFVCRFIIEGGRRISKKKRVYRVEHMKTLKWDVAENKGLIEKFRVLTVYKFVMCAVDEIVIKN